jgi:hypothetical protein
MEPVRPLARLTIRLPAALPTEPPAIPAHLDDLPLRERLAVQVEYLFRELTIADSDLDDIKDILVDALNKIINIPVLPEALEGRAIRLLIEAVAEPLLRKGAEAAKREIIELIKGR